MEELSSYTQPLTSLTFDFITHLVIAGGCEFSTNELLCLTSIKNLGVLELIQPADEVCAVFSQVNDRLIRGWTEMEDPFPLLRILRIWGDHGITQKSLRLVSKFPALAMYDILGSREDWPSPGEQAHVHGWELAQPVSGLEDSLLRYLMLLAPIEDTRNVNLRELARSVDTDLVSLCSDSLCVVKFMPDRQAPALLDYLTDAAKVDTPVWDPDAASRDSRSCHDVAFEPGPFGSIPSSDRLAKIGTWKAKAFAQTCRRPWAPSSYRPSPWLACFLATADEEASLRSHLTLVAACSLRRDKPSRDRAWYTATAKPKITYRNVKNWIRRSPSAWSHLFEGRRGKDWTTS